MSYPSQNKKQSIQNVIDFSEQDNHILITKTKYFNGCEASNVIYVNNSSEGVRNALLRAVQNVICIQLGTAVKINGMKKDNAFG